MSGSWNNGLFGCFSPIGSCCLATWCPCILYGKTQGRREGDPEPSACNGSCLGWCALSLCSLQFIMQTISRGNLRHEHGISGNGCTDCLVSCCCACCALVQEDKEVKAARNNPIHGAPKPQAPMVYGPQH